MAERKHSVRMKVLLKGKLTGACLFRILWIMTIFSMPQFHTLQMLYISYPVSWALTFSIHMICYLTIAKKKLQDRSTPL